MLGFARRKVAEEIGPRSVPEEVILREAYHIGRHSASNVACPPAPGGIPVWVENNVESFSILVDRLSREYRIPDALSSRVYRRLYDGFCDLVRSQADEGSSPFCLCRDEVFVHGREIFLSLAKRRQVRLDPACLDG